jgi:beta-phosphoglucomutase
MKYQAVIFDLDGVICFTDRFHYQAWKRIAEELGITFNEKINNRLRGVSRMESLDIILEAYEGQMSDEQKQHYAAKKNEIYKRLIDGMSAGDTCPNVRAILDRIRGKGIKMAIGSSSRNARFILERIGLGDYFDAVSDGTNISRSKPDPEVFFKASEFVNVEPKACLVVEDAESGIRAALAAGMDCAAIGGAVSCGLATYCLEQLADILPILGCCAL